MSWQSGTGPVSTSYPYKVLRPMERIHVRQASAESSAARPDRGGTLVAGRRGGCESPGFARDRGSRRGGAGTRWGPPHRPFSGNSPALRTLGSASSRARFLSAERDRRAGRSSEAGVEVAFRSSQRARLESSGLPELLAQAVGATDGAEAAAFAAALQGFGLVRLARAGVDELVVRGGLPPGRAEQLRAVFELGRRVEQSRWGASDSIRTPGGVYRLMAPRLRGLERETFHVLLLDGRHRLTGVEQVSEGTLSTSLVHPREVFLPAIRQPAAAIVVVHNHPSGDPEPSPQDYEVTRRLADSGRLIGIPLLDHVVVGEGRHVSIRERIEF